MFRGRPPFRGYPPPVRPYPSQGYRDDRARPRPPYHQDYPEYRDHGASEAYHRRHPSPGPGGHRGGDFWTGGAPPERSPSHRGPAHLDHNLVISVGNELTGPPSHHDRQDYLPRPEYERSGSRGRSPGRSRGRSKSRHRGESRSPDRSRGRSKSRHRGESRSPDRSRGRSKSRHRGESRSPDRSRGRSKSRAKSRGRSKSRARSKSRSSSRSRGKSRGRSRSLSSSSSSSSSSIRDKNDPSRKQFKELELARRRREVEELLGQPTKSILKKHNSYEDSPSLRRSDSPRDLDRTMARVADQLMQAVKLNDPRAVAAVLSELRSDPQMSQRANLNNEIKEILNLLGVAEPVGGVSQRVLDDIDDEEKFLYGELEEPKMSAAPEPDRHHSLDLYGDVTEDSLYSDLPSQRAMAGQVYSCPPTISPHLQVTPSVSEPNRHMSQPSISPNQNVMAYPPGTEPLEESERQALKEYEKIQDLLKTIGLDLGVGEISKMAARTKERLHGNKQPPKTPTRRRYSSGSSNGSCHSRVRRRRSQSGSSSSSRSRSRSHGRGTKRGASWSSEDHESKKTTAAKTSKDWEVKETKNEWSTPMLPQSQTSDTAPIPTHTGMPIPTYPPPQLPGMMPPNYPPSAYSQYGNYLPYIHQQWPPMYPPPNMTLPPQPATENLTPPPTYKKAYRKPTPETGALGFARSVGQEEQRRRSQDQSISDEQNNESEKLKVLEEREKLRQEREVRMTKKEYLIKELERLRKQQGELLRKKRREKDGHKDPLLQEINRLQDEVMAKISNLRKEHEAAERKRTEIEKVAQILGLSPLDRPGKTSKLPKIRDQEELHPKSEKREQGRNPEEQPAAGSTALKATPATSTKASPERLLFTAEAPPPDPFEYYDAGNHWCKNCNITSGSMFDFFTHLHSKPHRKTLDPYDRPWASSPTKTPKTTAGDAKRTKPAKGSEFLVPVRGFFCLLCKEFYGDAICAEEHVITHSHNEKYKKQMVENPLYEQRRNLDRQAGLGLEAGGKKRKYDDDDKDRDDKNKNKKDKKKEEEAAETCDEKIKVKKEEEEQKVKAVRKSLEEDKFYSKKDEDEKYKQSKKEEKHNSRENEDRNSRYRGSSRDEEYRHRHRRDDDGHPKYGNKCTEDKYKEEKCSDSRSKHDRERDEGKHKAEPEKPGGKPDARKSEPPPKPYELPKIFCGPSPAMRAKLRKQAMEASKAPASAASASSFGKFTWKKKENQLAKEAQKVAAEFLKDEEAAAKEKPGEEEDSFSKSVAAAKEIAEKLAGEELKSPPWYTSGRGQIRPNLRAPVAPLRRASLAGKPASLNTFLNMRPQSTDGGPPGPFPRAPFRPPNPQMFNNKPGPPVSSAGPLGVMSAAPTVTRPEQFGPKLPPSMLKPGPCQNTSKPDSAESKPEMKQGPLFPKPAPVQSKPATGQSSPSTTSPAPLNTASSETRSAPSEVKAATPPAPAAPLTPSKATPSQPALIKIVSDVAAPGVPESEQTRTVFVKPPPFKSMLAGPQKSEKLQGNLAAAKAQALFDIFYSSLGQAGPSSFSRTETDVGAGKGSPSAPVQNKNQPQNKPEPQIQSQDQTQTPNILPTQTHNQSEPPDEPRPQTQEMPESQPQVEPQLQNEPKALKLTQPQPQQQTQQKPESQPPDHQKEPSHEPQTAPQHHSLSPTSTEPPNTIPTSPQNGFQSPQTQADGDIQITSVWSLQDITAPTDKAAGPEPSDPPPHSEQTPSAPTEGLSQSPPTSPGRKSQICPQTKPISMEPAAEPLFQPETQFEPQIDQDANSHQETTPEPQPKPKPSPRTRGKAAAMKKTPSAAPVRQTRSQTRYQTRQQQSQPEPEQNPGAGNQDLTASEAKGLESPDPEQEAASHREMDPPGTDVTTETLGLPSDMTALDFDYTFNFE